MRQDPKIRRQSILTAAVNLARKLGYISLTRDQIAAAANVSPALVSVYIGDMRAVREAILREAVRLEVVEVVAQGLAAGEYIARNASTPLKAAAARHLAGL